MPDTFKLVLGMAVQAWKAVGRKRSQGEQEGQEDTLSKDLARETNIIIIPTIITTIAMTIIIINDY